MHVGSAFDWHGLPSTANWINGVLVTMRWISYPFMQNVHKTFILTAVLVGIDSAHILDLLLKLNNFRGSWGRSTGLEVSLPGSKMPRVDALFSAPQ